MRTPIELLPPELPSNISEVIAGLIAATEPQQFVVTRIDNWFGPKWLGFKYKLLGAFGVRAIVNLDKSWPLRVPPFHPHRVRAISCAVRAGDCSAWSLKDPPILHIHQRSSDNGLRKFAHIAGDRTCAVWLGDDGAGRWAVMVYRSGADGETAWYVDCTQEKLVGHDITQRELATLASVASGHSWW